MLVIIVLPIYISVTNACFYLILFLLSFVSFDQKLDNKNLPKLLIYRPNIYAYFTKIKRPNVFDDFFCRIFLKKVFLLTKCIKWFAKTVTKVGLQLLFRLLNIKENV